MSDRVRAWVELGRQLIHEIREDQVVNGAAALAFFTMLALFPAAIFGLSLLPYLPIPHLRQAIFELLFEILPPSAAELFTGTVTRIMSARNGGLLSFGLVFAVWSASSGLGAVMQQLNVVYGVTDRRSYIKTRAMALLLMLLFFALLFSTFALVIFGGVLQDWTADLLGWSDALRSFFAFLRWVLIAFALLSAFALVYRLAPDVDRPLQLFGAGNVFATAGFLLASFGFRTYVDNFASYNTTYGGLGAVIVLLLWLFIVGAVILIGGEINDIIERARSRKAQREAGAAVDQPSSGPHGLASACHRSAYVRYATSGQSLRDSAPTKQRELRRLAKSEPLIEHISRAAALYPRPQELLLHIEVDLRKGSSAQQIERALRGLARSLLQSDPEARHFYLEASFDEPASGADAPSTSAPRSSVELT